MKSVTVNNEVFSIQYLKCNGITVRAAVEGRGPLVILVHGWPEIWYSWRHQIKAIAKQGYRVVAPDIRGYGGSDSPAPVEAYDMLTLAADIIGLMDVLGEKKAILAGHDWGAPICWNTALLYPDRVAAVAGLSIPYIKPGKIPVLELYKKVYKDRFFYQLYFQEPGVAEAEFEADVRTSIKKIFYVYSGDATADDYQPLRIKKRDDPYLNNLTDPDPFPAWLTKEDLDYYEKAFTKSGFKGGFNRYRAQNRDFDLLSHLSDKTIDQPSCFIAGELDPVRAIIPGTDLFKAIGRNCTDFRGKTIVKDKGHWIQQEAPGKVNQALLDFFSQVRGF